MWSNWLPSLHRASVAADHEHPPPVATPVPALTPRKGKGQTVADPVNQDEQYPLTSHDMFHVHFETGCVDAGVIACMHCTIRWLVW